MIDPDREPTRETRPSNRPILIAAAAVVVVAALAGFFLWRSGERSGPPPLPTATPVAAEPTPTPRARSARIEGVALADSDPVVARIAGELSKNPHYLSWLAHDDLVRRFVASVANVAEGKSPRPHLGFLAPKGRFKVEERDGELVVDPASYERYDTVASVVASLDPQGIADLYAELEPLFDDAYAEIARPGASFRDTVERAIDELLAVPVGPADAAVREQVMTYAWVDPQLEGLSEAQRHLLRMGPDNVRRVQDELRAIRAALENRWQDRQSASSVD